jgi:hypothetical protein
MPVLKDTRKGRARQKTPVSPAIRFTNTVVIRVEQQFEGWIKNAVVITERLK